MKNLLKKLRDNELFKTIALNFFIAIVYILSAKIGLRFASINPSTTALWPPTGIALAVLLVYGNKVLPAIFFGAFIANITTAGTVISSLAIAFGNTLEGEVGAYLVSKYAKGLNAFDKASSIIKFIILAGIISTTVSATIGVLTLFVSSYARVYEIFPIWITWWLGDMGGNFIIAPLLLIWRNASLARFNIRKILLFSIAILAIFGITTLVFNGTIPYAYLCIPIAVGTALWFGQFGASLSTFFVAIIAIVYTINGQGPFSHQPNLNQSLLLLQMFTSIFSITALIFASTILEIKRNKGKLNLYEKRFQSLIENSFDAIVLIDATSKITYASPSVKRLLGYSAEELEGKIGFDLVLPEDKALTMHILTQLVLQPGSVRTVEYRTIRKDYRVIWVEATGTNLLFDPNVNAVVVNFHDITEKKEAEKKLLREKREDEAMLTSIGEGIIATDDKGIIRMVNNATCTILGWEKNQILGKSIVNAIPMEDEKGKSVPVSKRPMTNVILNGKTVETSTTLYYIRKDKVKIPVRFTVTPIILDGVTVGTIEVFYDLTKEKQIEKSKNELITLASHQLRTPLSTINWYSEYLIDSNHKPSDKDINYLNEINKASHRMIDLVNALLNTSSLELGTFAIEPKEIDYISLINQVIEELRPKIQVNQVDIQKNYQEAPLIISADPKLLIIIIQNLLSNAIKYSKKYGKVKIDLIKDEKKITLKVIDNGIGIPKSQQNKLFTKLFRTDNAKQFNPEGTGLGLYTIKLITDATGGKVSFNSIKDRGTTFTVEYPISGMKK